jgi:hypothetical protein
MPKYVASFFLFAFIVPLPALGALCGNASAEEANDWKCPMPYEHRDPHKQAILQTVATTRAIEEVATDRYGQLNLAVIVTASTWPTDQCNKFMRDFVNLDNVKVLYKESFAWDGIREAYDIAAMPTLDKKFKEWRVNGHRVVNGYVVVRWKAEMDLAVRLSMRCDNAACDRPRTTYLNVHSRAPASRLTPESWSPRIACFMQP